MLTKKLFVPVAIAVVLLCTIQACKKQNAIITDAKTYPAIQAAFGDNINLNSLENYAQQTIPVYIKKGQCGQKWLVIFNKKRVI